MRPLAGVRWPTRCPCWTVKPQAAVGGENDRVRIAARRQPELTDLAASRIEAADRSVAVAGVPDAALSIDNQAMRFRPWRQLPLKKTLRRRFEARDAVALHDRDVNGAIGTRRRIARKLWRRYRPFADLAAHRRQRTRRHAVVGSAGKGGSTAQTRDRKQAAGQAVKDRCHADTPRERIICSDRRSGKVFPMPSPWVLLRRRSIVVALDLDGSPTPRAHRRCGRR